MQKGGKKRPRKKWTHKKHKKIKAKNRTKSLEEQAKVIPAETMHGFGQMHFFEVKLYYCTALILLS